MNYPEPPNQSNRPHPAPLPPITPSPPRPDPRRNRLFIIAATVLVVAVAAVVVIWRLNGNGDGNASGAAPAEPTKTVPKVDLSTLDIGTYDVKPREFAGQPTLEEGRYLQAYSLAQWIVPPPDVIPTLTYVNGLPVTTPAAAATSVSGNGVTVIQPVLEKHGMITGYLLSGYPKPVSESVVNPDPSLLNIMVTSFPSAEQASQAAAEMDATDFAVNPANVHVPIPNHPDAHAHYVPGNPTIAATMARKATVVSIFFGDPGGTTADLLAAGVQRVLDAMVPLLDQAVALPEASLTMAPIDPDHMLSRLLVKGPTPTVGPTFAVLAGGAAVICEGSPGIQQNLFGVAGVDRCAGSDDGTVTRARDEAAAKDLLTKSVDIDPDVDHKITPPPGVPDAICVEQKPDKWKDAPNYRFGCSVTYGRYVASVFNGEQKGVLQAAAAQYALLVNND
jgi:hypothetical protein